MKPSPTPMALNNEKPSKNDGKEKDDASVRILKSCWITALLHKRRPDVVHVNSTVSRFMDAPSMLHFAATKRILRYVQGTKSLAFYLKLKKTTI